MFLDLAQDTDRSGRPRPPRSAHVRSRTGPDLRHHAARRRADRRRRLQRARQASRSPRRSPRARVDVIEAGFPVSSPQEMEAVRGVARHVRDARICALARAVPKDVEAAGEALRAAAAPRIHVFVNASDVQLAHQLRASRAKVVGMVRGDGGAARATSPTTSSSARWTRRAPTATFVAELAAAAVPAPARARSTCRTRSATRCPSRWTALFAWLRARVPGAGGRGAVVPRPGRPGPRDRERAGGGRGAARARSRSRSTGSASAPGNTAFEEVVMALRVHGRGLGVRDRRRRPGHLRALAAGRRAERDRGARRTRRWSAATPSATPPASTRTACSSSARPTSASTRRRSATRWARRSCWASCPGARDSPRAPAAIGLPADERAVGRAFVRFQALAAAGVTVGDDDLRTIFAEAERAA